VEWRFCDLVGGAIVALVWRKRRKAWNTSVRIACLWNQGFSPGPPTYKQLCYPLNRYFWFDCFNRGWKLLVSLGTGRRNDVPTATWATRTFSWESLKQLQSITSMCCHVVVLWCEEQLSQGLYGMILIVGAPWYWHRSSGIEQWRPSLATVWATRTRCCVTTRWLWSITCDIL